MILLDTNVLSALMRREPDRAVMTWLDDQPAESIWTTTITVFEVRTGIELLAQGRRRQQLEQATALAATQAKVVDAERQVAIAEFNARASVKSAEGQSQAKKINAEADATVLRTVGDAEAAKTHAVGGAEVAGAAGVDGAAGVVSLTRSFNSLLGLKKGIFFAGTSTRSPVFGLRPTRGLRCRVRKLPKPRISILSPARSERTTLSKIVSTITSLSFRVSSAKRETSSIRSALVIRPLLLTD